MNAAAETAAPPAAVGLLTVPEAAALLRVSERLVWGLLADDKLPSVAIEGCRRIERAALDHYIATRRKPAAVA